MADLPSGDAAEISAEQLVSWKLLGEFRRRLGKIRPAGRDRPPGGPPRLLAEEDYLCSFLFAQFNPVIDSARGLCACSDLGRVQEEVCTRHISLGSFSEAQSVFGPARLVELFEQLVREAPEALGPGVPQGSRHARLRAIDSTVLRALPRMGWAEWQVRGKRRLHAARLHLSFNLLDGEPADALVSRAKKCERAALKEMPKAGEFYVGDRNYGYGYKLLAALEESECGYAMRIRDWASMTPIEELPITDEGRRAGVVSDTIVRLGARGCWHHGPVRVIRIEKEDLEEPLVIATNRLDPSTHSAALIGAIYKERWKIEIFFKWFKCVLGRPGKAHWFAESEEGAAIQIYSALIAALLLSRRLGKLPSKRMMEMLRFHSMGFATGDELEGSLRTQLGKTRS